MMYDVVYKFIESEVSVLEGLKCSAAIKRTIADHVLGKHLEVLDEEADLFDCLHKLNNVSLFQWLKEFHNSDCVLLWNRHDRKPALVYWFKRFTDFPINKIKKLLKLNK